jgi:hypothetical protein
MLPLRIHRLSFGLMALIAKDLAFSKLVCWLNVVKL